jgi:hypothetical protein
MVGATPAVVWGIAIVLLGLALAYGVVRAGRLRRSERERLDQNTAELLRSEEAAERNTAGPDLGLRPDVPYAILVPVVVVGLAVALMIWSMHGTSMGTQQGKTTGSAVHTHTGQPVAVPATPNNDAASDSWRGPQGPVNKSE